MLALVTINNIKVIITENSKLLESSIDPIIVGITVIGKIRELF